MIKIFISDRAEEDLINQYRWYSDNASAEVAERFLISFDSTVERLTRSPQLGPPPPISSPQVGSRPIDCAEQAVRFASHFLRAHKNQIDRCESNAWLTRFASPPGGVPLANNIKPWENGLCTSSSSISVV